MTLAYILSFALSMSVAHPSEAHTVDKKPTTHKPGKPHKLGKPHKPHTLKCAAPRPLATDYKQTVRVCEETP